jgi:hypothetical protein
VQGMAWSHTLRYCFYYRRPLYDGKNDGGPGVTRAPHMKIINFIQYDVDSNEMQITLTVTFLW